jgi:hypothetical protein
MKRITPEEVLDAYAKTGLKPHRGVWLWKECGKRCGCGLGAMYVANGGDPPKVWSQEVIKTLGISIDYLNGFTCGFDDESPDYEPGGEEEQGYTDGLAAAAAVFQGS